MALALLTHQTPLIVSQLVTLQATRTVNELLVMIQRRPRGMMVPSRLSNRELTLPLTLTLLPPESLTQLGTSNVELLDVPPAHKSWRDIES